MIWREILQGLFSLEEQKTVHSKTPHAVCNMQESWIGLRLLVWLLCKVHPCPEPRLHWSHTSRHEGALPQTPQILYAFGFLITLVVESLQTFIVDSWFFCNPHICLTPCGLIAHRQRVCCVQPPSPNSSSESQAGLMVTSCPCTLIPVSRQPAPCGTGLTGVIATPGWCPVTWFPGVCDGCYSLRSQSVLRMQICHASV